MTEEQIHQAESTEGDEGDQKRKKRNKRILIAAGAAAGLLIVCCVGLTLLPSPEATPTPTVALAQAATETTRPEASPTEAPTSTPASTSTPAPTRTPAPTATKEVGTAGNPIPVGAWGNFTKGGLLSPTDFRLKVEDVIRGQAAWDKIYIANMFNDKPEEGFEWMLIQVSVEALGPDVDSQLDLTSYDFSMRTGGRIFDSFSHSVCCLDEVKLTQLNNVTLVTGGSYDGWLAFQVAVDDPDPLLILGDKFYLSTVAQ